MNACDVCGAHGMLRAGWLQVHRTWARVTFGGATEMMCLCNQAQRLAGCMQPGRALSSRCRSAWQVLRTPQRKLEKPVKVVVLSGWL